MPVMDDESLNTLGGDAGEFLVALHVYEHYFKFQKKLNKRLIRKAFLGFLHKMKSEKFEFCGSEKMEKKIKKELGLANFDLKNPAEE